MTKVALATLVALTTLGLIGASRVEAQCFPFNQVGPGGSWKLTADCAGPLGVIGPTTLDMHGHTVVCGTPANCLVTFGTGAVVENGVVQGQVVVVGSSAQIKNVVAEFGFVVYGSRNTLTGNTVVVVPPTDWGFSVQGTYNTFQSNVSTTGPDAVRGGFLLAGGNNTLISNTATGNTGDTGFEINSSGNNLRDNKAINMFEGFRVEPSPSGPLPANNVLIGNKAISNFGTGIHLAGATKTTVQGNVALSNGVLGGLDFSDLVDLDFSCVNHWVGNLFGSTNLSPCIH